MLRHDLPSRWLYPLAPLKRRSPGDLPPANWENVQKMILRMIVTIRRINCFTDTALFSGGFFYRMVFIMRFFKELDRQIWHFVSFLH